MEIKKHLQENRGGKWEKCQRSPKFQKEKGWNQNVPSPEAPAARIEAETDSSTK